MMRRFSLLAFIFFFLLNHASAQNAPWSGFSIETNAVSGKMIKHTKKFRTDMPPHSSAYEVNFLLHSYGRKSWQQRRNYPVVGFGFTYTNYGLDSVYGKCFAIYPNVTLPLVRAKRLEWTIRFGFGLGYATKHFERYPVWDTLNTAIGSAINNYTLVMTDLRYRINKHWDVQVGGNFSHMSNAAFRTPNLGINMYGAHVGLRYSPVTSQPQLIKKNWLPLKNRWLIQARIGIAGTELAAPDGPLYPMYITSLYISKRYLSVNKAFAGLDYYYDPHLYAFYRNNEIYAGEEKKHARFPSIYIGNEFLFGHVGVFLQAGYYLLNGKEKDTPYYEKIGGNLYIIQREKGILKELYGSALLKAHLTQAELVELGLGLGF